MQCKFRKHIKKLNLLSVYVLIWCTQIFKLELHKEKILCVLEE